jgi:hypothetical protein
MSLAPVPSFQHCSDFEDISILPSQLDHVTTSEGACQTQPTSFADSECLIVRGAASAKTCQPPETIAACASNALSGSYSSSQSWQPSSSAQAVAAPTSAADGSDPAEDKRLQADMVDIIGSSGAPPVYDAGALAAFLRGVAPMMEQEIKRAAKSTALRRVFLCPCSLRAASRHRLIFFPQGLERRVGSRRRLHCRAACTRRRATQKKCNTFMKGSSNAAAQISLHYRHRAPGCAGPSSRGVSLVELQRHRDRRRIRQLQQRAD